MVGFGGAITFRDWLRMWTERLDRLEAYLSRQSSQGEPSSPPPGKRPNDYRHRRN
ncbi:MAG TPA: hypothetical protein PJ994_10610 [Tepidiformaceae bacterium]|nr:hypothetical protein [Tepidiformaceae bacterium]HMO96224.1 hypothetical protein [Tepidiformaceae bacterium]